MKRSLRTLSKSGALYQNCAKGLRSCKRLYPEIVPSDAPTTIQHDNVSTGVNASVTCLEISTEQQISLSKPSGGDNQSFCNCYRFNSHHDTNQPEALIVHRETNQRNSSCYNVRQNISLSCNLTDINLSKSRCDLSFYNLPSKNRKLHPTSSTPEVVRNQKENKLFTTPVKGHHAAEPNVLLKHVYAVNGVPITFTGDDHSGFKNWFGDEKMLSYHDRLHRLKGRRKTKFRAELDLWEFSSKDIRMGLYCGNKVIVRAMKPVPIVGKPIVPKTFVQTLVLPSHLTIDALVFCRNKAGRLVILERARH